MEQDIVERKVGELTIRIKRDTCVAFRACMAIAPQVFRLDEEQLVAFQDAIGEIDRDKLLEACNACPVEALEVYDQQGNKLVPKEE